MLLAFVLVYIAITILVGCIAASFVKTSRDFTLAGQSMPVYITASALFATWLGSETIMGASNAFVAHGIRGVIEDPFGAALCLILLGLFFTKPLYKLNLLTMGDLFLERFGQKAGMIAAIAMIASYFTWTSAQLIAFALIFKLITNLDINTGLWITGLIIFAYTFAGGMLAITITDFIQTIAIIVGLFCLALIFIKDAGGFYAVINSTTKGFWDFGPKNTLQDYLQYINAWLIVGLGSLPQQDLFQRIMSAKNAKSSQQACFIGGFMYLSIAFLPLLIGLAVKKIYPDLHGESLILDAIMRKGNLWLEVLFFGALLSAIMSTASASILAPATTLAENILKPYLPKLSDKDFLKLLRISVLIMTIIGIVLALNNSSIYALVGQASALSLVSLFVPFIAALYWKQANELGALLSMFLGLIVWSIYEFIMPCNLNGLIIPSMLCGLVASFLGMFIGIALQSADHQKTSI